MKQPDLNDSRRKALIFQRRQIENERNVEEIVRTNTEKVSKIELFFRFNYLFLFRHFTNVVEIIKYHLKLDQSFHHSNDLKYHRRTLVCVCLLLFRQIANPVMLLLV
jgi:hypothetical protein